MDRHITVAAIAIAAVAGSDGTSIATKTMPNMEFETYNGICDDDHGLPRFSDLDQLQASPWAKYLLQVYGELPKKFPFCVYDLWHIDPAAAKKAGVSLPSTTKKSGYEDGDFIGDGSGGGIIYHSQYKPLPNNTWVEIAHTGLPTELRGMWVWRKRGSGIWAFTGNTIVFPEKTRKNPGIHDEAIKFLTKDCKAYKGYPGWPLVESVVFGDCAKEKGYDSVQFKPEGLDPLQTFNMIDSMEMVLTRMDGQYTCGTKNAAKTPLRAGWMASQSCKCVNSPLPDTCGLMPTAPGGIKPEPPLCKVPGKCSMASCPQLKCELPSTLVSESDVVV